MTDKQAERIIKAIRAQAEHELELVRMSLVTGDHDDRIAAGAQVGIQAVVNPAEFLPLEESVH